jgi:hypothetical protein
MVQRNRAASSKENKKMTSTDQMQRILHSKPEAAMLMCISLRKLDYMISLGELKTVRLGKRRMVPRAEIERIAKGAKYSVISGVERNAESL